MTIREKVLYHQVHPLKLTADAAAIVAGAVLLWHQHLLRAMTIGAGLPIAASVIVIQFVNLDRLAQSRSGRYVARYMTRWTVVARVIGVFIAWEGAWYRSAFWCCVGMLMVALVWARGLLDDGRVFRISRSRVHPLSITAPAWATDVITVGLLLATMVNVVVSYVAGHSFRAYVIENSDLLYLPTLFSDVFAQGGRLSDWFLTPAPYFFPDYPLYLLAYVLGAGTYIRIAIFAVVQIGATLCAMWLLTRRLSPSNAFLAAVTITIALVWLALSAGEPFVILLASASHYGTFLSTILFAALWIQYETLKTPSGKRLRLVAICMLVFLATLSDNLFIVQGILPFTATVIAMHVTQRAHSARRERFGPVLTALWIALTIVVPVLTYGTPMPPPSINVAWAGGVDDQQRATLEARFHLTDGDSRGGGLWTYRLADTTKANVAALVRDPDVGDTQHIDRQSFTVDGAEGPLRRAVSTVPIGLALSTFVVLCWVFARDVVRDGRKRGVWAIGLSALVPVLFSGLGFISYGFLVANPTRYPPSLGLEKIYGNLTDLSVGIARAMTATPVFGISVVAYVGLMLFALMRPVVRGSDVEHPSPLAWLTVFSLAAICSTIVAASVVTDLPVMPRYLIPVFFWPVVIVPLIVHHHLGRRFVVVGTALSLLAVVSLTSVSYRLGASNGVSGRYYPSDIACLDSAIEREGLHNGIAQYWDAKYLQQFSRLDLNIAQYSDDLAETKWITSLRYFRQRYDFAVLSKNGESTFDISSDDLTRMNGAPRRIVGCGSRMLYIYGTGQLRTRSSIAGQRPSDRSQTSITVQMVGVFRGAKENVLVG